MTPARPTAAAARALLLAVSLLATTGCASAPHRTVPAAPADRMAELTDRLRTLTGAPGLVVAIADSGGVRVYASGVAVVEHGVPVDGGTRFRLASTSKAVTATLLAALWDRGAIDLDRPVGDHLAELPSTLRPVTPRQLAGHLAGIRGYEPGDSVHDVRRFATARDALGIFADDPLRAPPGAAYGYTTFGYTVLEAAMEAAAGAPFEELLRAGVAGPLGLRSLTVDDPRRVVPGRTGFYERAPDGAVRRAPYVDPGYKVAGAGLLATGGDLARLGLALLDDRLLSDSARAVLFEPQRTLSGEETGVGLGWRIDTDPLGRAVRHHEGSMAGARSALLVYPDEGVAVALLTNLTATPLFAFESAAGLVGAALAPRDGACLAAASADWDGEAVLDGIPTDARLRLRTVGGRVDGAVALGESPLPVARTLPVLDGWCRGGDLVLLLGIGPGFGVLPVTLTPAGDGLSGRIEMQGEHSFELRLARRR